MIRLAEALGDAQRKRIAIGHFNVSDLVGLKAVTAAAQTLKVPVLVGTSEGERAVKSINPRIVVEGELGFIGSGSEIHESVPESSRLLTKAEDATRFVEATQIDVLAPAVGNMHGLLKSMISGDVRKRLDIGRIREIVAATAVPLTLHGGSGTYDGDFQKAISAGITIVHISTELRLAWRHGLEAALAENSDEVVPYKIYNKSLSARRRSPTSVCAYSTRGEFPPATRLPPVRAPLRGQGASPVSGSDETLTIRRAAKLSHNSQAPTGGRLNGSASSCRSRSRSVRLRSLSIRDRPS
jgi:fructose/tagatose bisphosphate aldolase